MNKKGESKKYYQH